MRADAALRTMPVVTEAAPDPATDRARVVLVDDDRVLLRVLADALSRRLEGAEVVACSSPMAALASIEAGDVDVVISDLVMADMHGLELLDRVRRIRPSSMVVLITGAADRDLSVRALRGGAYDFIQKPVDPEYLAACVRRAVETRRLRAEVERQQEALRRHAEELEQTVAERTEELRRANRTKDEFLATVSHELRTPLTAILGWARLLCGGRLDPAEHAQAIESIGRNARSQAQLIDDLLDVSRIITGKLRLEVRPVDLFRVLDGALGVVSPAAQAKDIEVVSQVDEAVGPIQGDPHRLQQVLWNLLSNAVKFTPPGGHVSVSLSRRGEHAEIVVRDDGDGIEPDFLPFVFDRFRQGESHLSSRRGLGLGLAIARHLVELHGGTVTAQSAGPGKGAAFTVVLPGPARPPSDPLHPRRGRSSTPSPVELGVEPNACLRGVRVLVIDDDSDTRQVLRLMLEHAGASVGLASSVAEAHEAFRQTRPDVLLCDIGLGSDDGYSLLRALRALPRELGGGVPAIALTGYAKPEDRARALVAGFDLHVAKPGPADLPAVIAGLLQRGDLE
jgi:signal transduction histidine kinase